MTNIGTYFARLRELVALELEEEKRGERPCRYPVRLGNTAYNPLGQLTLELHYEVSEDEVEQEFEPGKPVTLYYLSNTLLRPSGTSPNLGEESGIKELPHLCYIEHVTDGNITVSLPNKAAEQSIRDTAQRQLLGVMLGVDSTSYRVMTEALREAERKEDERFVRLRDVLVGNRPPAFRSLPQLSFPWLNRSQQDAIQRVVEAQDVSIVHGPPGTGKTTTLVEAIIETLQRETQVLVCAPSNAAVDWISEQLMRRGIHVLRVGNPLRMSDEMLDCSYERRYAAHPDYHELWNIRKALREGAKGEHAHRLRNRETELEIKINADLFEQARVVSCTLIGSAYRIMERRRFSTLFIDEAAQALEPACWAAILRADRMIMSGDHQQLPPTVKSLTAAKGGLAETLMQKVVKLWPQCVDLLTVQYRMNEEIMSFSSRWFYDGRLKAAPDVAHRLVSPLDTPLMWLDTSGHTPQSPRDSSPNLGEQQRMQYGSGHTPSPTVPVGTPPNLGGEPDGKSASTSASSPSKLEGVAVRPGACVQAVVEECVERRTRTSSLTNAQEARLVIHTLRDYIEMVSPQKIESERIDFGIITPYRGQARLIRRLLKMQHYFRRLKRHITLGTVDGFQGQERDVIVISLVRDNTDGQIGFLRDLRRMNVAITRARMKLIIIGNAETLSRHRFYRELAEHFRRHGEFVEIPPAEKTEYQQT